MQAVFDALFNLLPYHLLAYGALLATGLFQCFVDSTCHRTLIFGEFSYYQSQLGLAILTAVTRPPYSIFSFATNPWSAAPLAIVLVAGSLNWAVFSPRISRAEIDRQSLREQASDAKSTGTAELGLFRQANQDSVEVYASSVRLNTIALIATVWYAFSLASSIVQEELPFQTDSLRV
ncbi:hypothetical protein ATEIFO6365_0004026500 [Aspergillus terreus]|uniref:TMEM205-like domain-containing protein n=1 Tax=Aspergillus terreus TaxID=33178 RepID=A0A5M3YSE2_ASPTE|nr:hypothetical protein ATETN484_0002029000 [Aspergillus terreus]GFF15146.1 hypothetical protein ATEIFO6365_0004026500 [Aspergillus terreus]